MAVYTDHAGHFGQWQSDKGKRTETIVSGALAELDVELILAGSPQAKGRVERSFGTAQDRLVKEMRVAGISTFEKANDFLAEYWVPLWNDRFTTAPREALDAHRPLPSGVDLDALFAETETRKVARDFTIRFENRRWQIPEREAGDLGPGAEVVVESRLDGQLRFRNGGRYLDVEPLGRVGSRTRVTPARSADSKRAKHRPKPPKPSPDHPWRKRVCTDIAAREQRDEQD